MSSSIDIKAGGLSGLRSLMRKWEYEPYRAEQIGRWLYKHDVPKFSRMSNLPHSLVNRLENETVLSRASVLKQVLSSDGSIKALVAFEAGESVELVYIPLRQRSSVCISSQTGCAMGCVFCATALRGRGRNLNVGELLEQYYIVQRPPPDGLGREKPTHIVFMGMGEPLRNTAQVLKAIRILTWSRGPGYSPRRITLSTCGVEDGIRELAESGIGVRLAISLHSPFEEERRDLMPGAGRLTGIIPQAREYADRYKQRITFEYTLFKDVNDSLRHARALAALCRTLPSKVNIIPWNPVPGIPCEPSPLRAVESFIAYLKPRVPAVTLRRSRGADIGGGCGQLAGPSEDHLQ